MLQLLFLGEEESRTDQDKPRGLRKGLVFISRATEKGTEDDHWERSTSDVKQMWRKKMARQ